MGTNVRHLINAYSIFAKTYPSIPKHSLVTYHVKISISQTFRIVSLKMVGPEQEDISRTFVVFCEGPVIGSIICYMAFFFF